MTSIGTEKALTQIARERDRQDAKWGEQRHGMAIWAIVLGEEVGEASAEILRLRSTPKDSDPERAAAIYALRAEVIQVAAVACAWLEHLNEAYLRGDTLLGEVWE